jgi:hypothetical protein
MDADGGYTGQVPNFVSSWEIRMKFINMCRYIDDLEHVAELRPAHRTYMVVSGPVYAIWLVFTTGNCMSSKQRARLNAQSQKILFSQLGTTTALTNLHPSI